MRHKISGKQLCIKEDHRRAMLRNLAEIGRAHV